MRGNVTNVVRGMSTLQSLEAIINQAAFQRAVDEAECDYAIGRLLEHEEVIARMQQIAGQSSGASSPRDGIGCLESGRPWR